MVSTLRNGACPTIVSLAVLFVAGCTSVPISPARSSSNVVNKAVGVQELRRELAGLRNAVEVQGNQLEHLRERQRQLYDDLDYRLRQYEQASRAGRDAVTGRRQLAYGQQYGQVQEDGQEDGQEAYDRTRSDTRREQLGSGRRARGAAQAGGQQMYGQQGISRGQQASRQNPGDAQSHEPGDQALQTASRREIPEINERSPSRRVVASAEEQAAYDAGFELLKQSRYADAILEFRSMIEQFPRGALIDDAQYWIGEAYYVIRDFEQALDAFQTVVNQYPESQRIPQAMLKLGYVQAEMGRTQQARRILNRVISRHPGSRVAISAETRLSTIQ